MSKRAIAPPWANDLLRHMEVGYGFGIDLNNWAWCERAHLIGMAQALSHDKDFMLRMEKYDMQQLTIAHNKAQQAARNRVLDTGAKQKIEHRPVPTQTQLTIRQKRLAKMKGNQDEH